MTIEPPLPMRSTQRHSSSSTASKCAVARSKSRNLSSLQPPARRPSPLERTPPAIHKTNHVALIEAGAISVAR